LARCTRAAIDEKGESCARDEPGVRRGDAWPSLPAFNALAGDAGGLCGNSMSAAITSRSKGSVIVLLASVRSGASAAEAGFLKKLAFSSPGPKNRATAFQRVGDGGRGKPGRQRGSGSLGGARGAREV
jgi:hypothetical protein